MLMFPLSHALIIVLGHGFWPKIGSECAVPLRTDFTIGNLGTIKHSWSTALGQVVSSRPWSCPSSDLLPRPRLGFRTGQRLWPVAGLMPCSLDFLGLNSYQTRTSTALRGDRDLATCGACYIAEACGMWRPSWPGQPPASSPWSWELAVAPPLAPWHSFRFDFNPGWTPSGSGRGRGKIDPFAEQFWDLLYIIRNNVPTPKSLPIQHSRDTNIFLSGFLSL